MEIQHVAEYFVSKSDGFVRLNDNDHPLIMNYIKENENVIAKRQNDLNKDNIITDHYIPSDDFKAMSEQIVGTTYDKDFISVLFSGNTVLALQITRLY